MAKVAPFSLSLAGKTVLITGASKGIGRACASRFAEQGCNLLLVSRTRADLETAKREIEASYSGITVGVFDVDLGKRGSVERLMKEIPVIPSILVNNAGAIPGGTLLKLDEETWREAWDLKVFGYINMSRAVYAKMQESGLGGVIVNIIGAAANNPRHDYVAGSMANIALEQLTRALGGRSLKDGIRVVGIHPGAILTDRLQKLVDSGAMSAKALEGPFKPGVPEDIADLTAFLASPLARNITGAMITSDGGSSSRM